jgi:hypothetical protein
MRALELVRARLAWDQRDVYRLVSGDFDRATWSRQTGHEAAGREDSRSAEIVSTVVLIDEV